MSAQEMPVKKIICFYYMGLIIYAAARKIHVIIHIQCVYCNILSVAWKFLEFPAMADDLHSYILQCLRKNFS